MSRIRAALADKFSRDLIWNVASLGIAGVAGVAGNSLIGAVYGATALGVFSQVFSLFTATSQVAVLGVHASVLSHIPPLSEPGERRAVVMSGLGAAALVALITAAGFVAMAPLAARVFDSPGVATGALWITPGLVCFALDKVTLAVLNSLRRMRAYAIFQAGRMLLAAIGLGVCLILHVRAEMLPLAISIAEAITLLLSLVTISDQLGPVPRERLLAWMRVHLRFGARGFLSGFFGELNNRIDVIILAAFASDAVVGGYSMASMLAEGFFMVLAALRANYAPIAVRLLAEGRESELLETIARGRRRVYAAAVAVGAVAVPVYALVIPLVTRDPEIAHSWPYFGILLAGLVVSSGYLPFNQILLWARRPGWHTVYIAITGAFLASVTLVLVRQWSAMGAALGFGGTYFVSVVLLRVFCARVLKLRI